MDYGAEFKKYFTSHQTSLAVRVTISVVLPPIVFYYLGLLPIGAAMSLGALCTSLTDTPGPPHHRRNGFYASIALNAVTAVVVGFTNAWHVVLGAEIVVLGFLFSFIAVYGVRAGNVGILALLVLILNIDSRRSQVQVVLNGLYIAAGGVWYAFLSLVLYTIFPYRLAQQAVGESIISVARYFRIKARFYATGDNFDDAYDDLMKEQVVLQQQQDQVRELLFKTRRIVNDSTPKSRVLLMMFVDSVDLFEMILSSQQDYRFLHEQFDGTGILEDFRDVITAMADELEAIGIAVQASEGYKGAVAPLQELQRRLDALDRQPHNQEGYISLQHILHNIRDIQERMNRLSLYTHYDQLTAAGYKGEIDYTRFITHQPIDAEVFADNLTLRSQAFRHALRLSLAMLVGYVVSRFMPWGHGYWIVMTISIILKPLFGSTRKLYFQRLGGTLVGAAVGGLVLYFVAGNPVLLGIMVVAMIIGYSMQKRDYFVYCIFLTVFVLIAFHLLYGHDFREILRDRVYDTVIGSCIALAASFVFLPVWSHETMRESMREMIRANQRYFSLVARAYTGRRAMVADFKVARKDAFVALANLSDNFQRILTEPRSKRKNVPFMHQFVVSSQMFAAHTASLAYYDQSLQRQNSLGDFDAMVRDVNFHLDNARLLLGDKVEQGTPEAIPAPREGDAAYKTVEDQFEILHTLSRDIEKAVRKYGSTLTEPAGADAV
ncbi:MAG TPA: FUSC family membrane protein [Dinghuibacter sp.]|uniref:FUSC family protein n=1 Tax=Dinghuibacter sp. TaxID=2024697 RepID=UPI002CDDA0FC|nr:FUSC family membrane protein [Dinghuibacter sp.]HTJ10729.1 FUSC family membrane protein [Dinghuibacter sp.]